jgi:sRNA-binding protein
MADEWYERMKTNLSALCELFPQTFTAAPFEAHRPLALGIDKKLVELGVLNESEVKAAIRHYVGRVMYNKSCITGAPRIDLAGNVAGQVTEAEAECSRARLREIMRKRDEQAEASRTARRAVCDARRAEQKADEWKVALERAKTQRLEKEAKQAAKAAAKQAAESQFAAIKDSAAKAGDGLASLRAAAAKRKAAELFRVAS